MTTSPSPLDAATVTLYNNGEVDTAIANAVSRN